VVAGWSNHGGIGHRAMVIPGQGETVFFLVYPSAAQAGSHNFNHGTIRDGFGDRPVRYFVNDAGAVAEPPPAPQPGDNELRSALLRGDAALREVAEGRRTLRPYSGQAHAEPGVGALQDGLRRMGYAIDDMNGRYRGYFGPQTERAVRGFQRAQGLPADGVVDQRTLLALDRALAAREPGDTPPAGGGGDLATDLNRTWNYLRANPTDLSRYSHLIDDADFGFRDAQGREFMSAADIQRFFENSPYGRSALADAQDSSGRLASQAIYDVARQYDVNPMLVVARLQTEFGLVSRTRPFGPGDLDWALGVGCYDNGTRDERYRGFDRQLEGGVRTLRHWFDVGREKQARGESLNLRVNYGSANLSIDNPATYALFKYCPHTTDIRLDRTGGGNYLFLNVLNRYFGGS